VTVSPLVEADLDAPVTGAAGTAGTAARPLAGRRVAITSTRKRAELRGLLERRGATVVEAPVLAQRSAHDPVELERRTRQVVDDGADVVVATTGTGVSAWFDAAEGWGLDEALLRALRRAEVLARGPKAVGALRRRGLPEHWQSPTERLEDVWSLLRARDLDGARVVLQEHGQSLAVEAEALRRAGAQVTVLSTYRCEAADDLTAVFGLVEQVVTRQVDAVTFTSAPAVTTLLQAAAATGLRDELVEAFRRDVVAMCVGPVTAQAWLALGVPAPHPDRSRLGAMVTALTEELRARDDLGLEVAGRLLLVLPDRVTLDGVPVRLSGAPYAVLAALAEQPGRVLTRRQLMARLPSGTARSEHAVEMAVARLRAVVGAGAVQTVVKRGYRLNVS
jgi:uroporphyrinogen-III synthase